MRTSSLTLAVVLVSASRSELAAQNISQPPSGDNQKAAVSQWIGPVELTVTYSSPDVHAPDGSDRRGKIWGQLVPNGYANLGFGTCGDKCPWRAGANENTVFRTSHPIEVEGKPLAAGSYGLHMLPGESEWTIIFSNNSTSWGSFTYVESEDALRVQVAPRKGEFREWLTYEFADRKPDRARLELAWEELAIPISIVVPNVNELYFERISRELRDSPGFTWQSWNQAVQFLLQSKIHLDTAKAWADIAVSTPFIGQENWSTLSTLSQVEEALGHAVEAKAAMDRAIAHPTADPVSIHVFARQLMTAGKKDEAIRIFELNAKKYPGKWPVEVGLMRAHAAQGKAKQAIAHGKLALASAPDDGNKQNLEQLLARLEKGDLAIN